MPFTVGWTFSVNSDIFVTALGVWDPTTGVCNHNSHSIGLWNENGTLLTSQIVSIDSPLYTSALRATLRFESIAHVVLLAGQTYRIGAEYTPDRYLDFYANVLNAPLSTSPEIVFGSAAKSPTHAGLAFPSVLDFSTQGFFGPNFMFTPVPEPRTISFLLLGLALALFVRRRQRPRRTLSKVNMQIR